MALSQQYTAIVLAAAQYGLARSLKKSNALRLIAVAVCGDLCFNVPLPALF